MAVRSKETIFNAALLRCGRSSSGGDTVLREAMEANYDEIVRDAFESGNGAYPFGKGRATLTSRSAGDFGFDDAYTFGADVIHILEVFVNTYACSDLQQPWEVDGANSKLMIDANSGTIEIEYIKQGQESTWSAAFALGVQRRLEAVIKDVLEETEEAELKEQAADFQFMRGSVKGSRNRSKGRVFKKGSGRLSRARRTRDTG